MSENRTHCRLCDRPLTLKIRKRMHCPHCYPLLNFSWESRKTDKNSV